MSRKTYDYIVVGGGSAGSALGNRLSADGSSQVLVLEAGHRDAWWDIPVRIPAALIFVMGHPLYDWGFHSEPEPRMAGRRIALYRGKVLGGSSNVNGMFYQRANPMVYETWARGPGMTSWDYAHCLPYFKRMETAVAADVGDPYRGQSGPLVVERSVASNPLFDALFQAAEQAGHALVDDINGYRQDGFGRFERNIHKGARLSASRAYLHPVMRRPNLEVRTGTLVSRVLFEGKRAVGVEIVGRRGRSVERAGEVILCGGAYNSPQLLQLSGVGDGHELRGHGIDVVHHLPGVGDHMADHLEAFVMYECAQPVSVARYLKRRNWPRIGAEWILRRSGPAATNHFEAGGFVRSRDDVEMPNQMLTLLPMGVRNDGTQPPVAHSYQINLSPQLPTSLGTVKLRSSDPRDAPVVRCNYLSTERDRRDWIDAVRLTRELLSQPAFEPFNGGELSPGPEVQTDDEILEWVSRDAETAYHPCGTCRMGIGEDDVVDPASMRVHGVDGLRVVDASVFPTITNANTYAPVMMVAEKAADLILGNTPLPPEHVDFYRSGTTNVAGAPTPPSTS